MKPAGKRTSRKTSQAARSGAAKVRRGRMWMAAAIVAGVGAIVGYQVWGRFSTAATPDPSVLSGRWLRSDGGYVLELRNPGADGRLAAVYLNPTPINVSRAEWRGDGGQLGVFVELRDVNYPGSTYTLVYEPATDRLVGLYFQAMQRQQFTVDFQRTR